MTKNCDILKRLLKDDDNQKKYKQLTNSSACKRYVPNKLSKEDKCKQIISIIQGKKRPETKSIKSKTSDWTKKAHKYFDGDTSLDNINKKLKVNKEALQEIIDKGKKAYFTSGSRPNQSPESWGIARLYAVLFGSPARNIDKDIVKKYKIPLLKGGASNSQSEDDVLVKKSFFSKELDKILELVSFNKKNTDVLGSFQLRSQLYFSDVDIFENNVKMPVNKIKNEFQNKIRKMLKDSTYYLADIKCGIAEELRVINENLYVKNSKVYFYNREASLKKIENLKKHIPKSIYGGLKSLLVKKPNENQINKIKKNLRFHVLRWTPSEILKGEKVLMNGKKMKFVHALKTDGLFKMDFYKFMRDSNFMELSIIYDVRNNKGQKLNNIQYDTKQTLLNDIQKYKEEEQYFKVLKRKFSLMRYEQLYEKKDNKKKIVILSKVLNSNLGQLYQAKSLLDNLLFLIENFDSLEKERINKSIDNIISKLSFISLKKFLKEEEDIIDELKMMLNGKSIGNISKNLLDIYERLENILNEESKKYIKLF